MSLIKWSPFFDGGDDIENILSNMTPAISRGSKSFVPAIDMYEDEKNVIIETELAGIDADGVILSIENDVLCIKGEGEKKSEVDDKDYYRKEIRRGKFYRSIQLPAHVDSDKAQAEATDGVLKITIPKEGNKLKSKVIKINKK